MKSFRGLSLLACLAVPAAAAPAASTFEAQAVQAAGLLAPVSPSRFQAHSPWRELTDKIVALGTFRDADQTLPATYGLEDVRGAKTAAHAADYANVWGFKDESGRFVPSFLTLVSEDWGVDAQGRWVIGQWLFTLSLDGTVTNVSRHSIVETRDHEVLDYQSQPKKAQDEDVVREREALLRSWTAFAR